MQNKDKFIFMTGDADNLIRNIVIKNINLIVNTMQMFYATELAHREIIRDRNVRLTYIWVIMKHLDIPGNSSTICFHNNSKSGLPYLVVIDFVSETTFASIYTENPYNCKNFKIQRINLFRNGMLVPRIGYQPNVA